jgi:hypothetical protein
LLADFFLQWCAPAHGQHPAYSSGDMLATEDAEIRPLPPPQASPASSAQARSTHLGPRSPIIPRRRAPIGGGDGGDMVVKRGGGRKVRAGPERSTRLSFNRATFSTGPPFARSERPSGAANTHRGGQGAREEVRKGRQPPGSQDGPHGGAFSGRSAYEIGMPLGGRLYALRGAQRLYVMVWVCTTPGDGPGNPSWAREPSNQARGP